MRISQRDIIRQLATGATYGQICVTMKITRAKLYSHMKRIREKGLEPSDINACRRYILGPSVKPLALDRVRREKLSPLQDKVLRLIDEGRPIEEIRHIMQIGFQTTKNAACEGFKRAGIDRRCRPTRIWRAQLRGYFQSMELQPITMDDPFFS